MVHGRIAGDHGLVDVPGRGAGALQQAGQEPVDRLPSGPAQVLGLGRVQVGGRDPGDDVGAEAGLGVEGGRRRDRAARRRSMSSAATVVVPRSTASPYRRSDVSPGSRSTMVLPWTTAVTTSAESTAARPASACGGHLKAFR